MNRIKLLVILNLVILTSALANASGFRCYAQCAIMHGHRDKLYEFGRVWLAADVSRHEAFGWLRSLCKQRMHKAGIYERNIYLLRTPEQEATEELNCKADPSIADHTPLPYAGDENLLP